ncbi:hypothetical protein GBAR_LOCUS20915 [Geodia barretti]|uniref:Uncharacterized protein n=1 Tax=Geodia barretti TaxID=519541 RepID=A0AA35SXV9_GEOBA|nr:hypothetical protein GBAR_LOCUS20915 [Geodia barretti]
MADQVVPQAEHLELAVEVAEYYDFFEDDLPVLHWLDVYYWMELEPPASFGQMDFQSQPLDFQFQPLDIQFQPLDYNNIQ